MVIPKIKNTILNTNLNKTLQNGVTQLQKYDHMLVTILSGDLVQGSNLAQLLDVPLGFSFPYIPGWI